MLGQGPQVLLSMGGQAGIGRDGVGCRGHLKVVLVSNCLQRPTVIWDQRSRGMTPGSSWGEGLWETEAQGGSLLGHRGWDRTPCTVLRQHWGRGLKGSWAQDYLPKWPRFKNAQSSPADQVQASEPGGGSTQIPGCNRDPQDPGSRGCLDAISVASCPRKPNDPYPSSPSTLFF